jgi:hypothetical protein
MPTQLKRDTPMKYNSTLADSASSENSSGSNFFVDDAWMLEESHAPKDKNFQKPTIWVSDIAATGKLATLFEVIQFGDIKKIPPGDHYLVAERQSSEESIKATAWKLKAAGIDCKVYGVQTSLDYLLNDETLSIQQAILHIIEFATTFDDWASRIDEQPLTTREAVNIAKSAIALIPEPEKSVELATLRKRCGESSYDWNRIMGNLEKQFQREIKRRRQFQKEVPPDSISNVPDSFEPDIEITQKAFQMLYGDKRWICVYNMLHCWGVNYYQHISDAIEIRRVRNFCNSYPVKQQDGSIAYPYANPASVEKILKWVKMSVIIDPSLLNPPGLNCTNGVLQLQSDGPKPRWKLIDHTPELYYTYPPIATYDPNADPTHCDRLLSALEPAQQEIFLRTIAASLDLATVRKYKGRAVRALLLKGDGSNGKDSLKEVVSMMFGRLGMTACTLSDFAAYGQQPRSEETGLQD